MSFDDLPALHSGQLWSHVGGPRDLKTMFALRLAFRTAERGGKVALCSYDDTTIQFYEKAVELYASLNGLSSRRAWLALESLGLIFLDVLSAREFAGKNNLGLLVIDGLFYNSNSFYGMKRLAVQSKTPVLVTIQTTDQYFRECRISDLPLMVTYVSDVITYSMKLEDHVAVGCIKNRVKRKFPKFRLNLDGSDPGGPKPELTRFHLIEEFCDE